MLVPDPAGSPLLQSPGITTVSVVDLVIPLRSGKTNLFGVHYDDEIACIEKVGISRLVLSHQHRSDPGSKTTQYFILGIDQIPVSFNRVDRKQICLHHHSLQMQVCKMGKITKTH